MGDDADVADLLRLLIGLCAAEYGQLPMGPLQGTFRLHLIQAWWRGFEANDPPTQPTGRNLPRGLAPMRELADLAHDVADECAMTFGRQPGLRFQTELYHALGTAWERGGLAADPPTVPMGKTPLPRGVTAD